MNFLVHSSHYSTLMALLSRLEPTSAMHYKRVKSPDFAETFKAQLFPQLQRQSLIKSA